MSLRPAALLLALAACTPRPFDFGATEATTGTPGATATAASSTTTDPTTAPDPTTGPTPGTTTGDLSTTAAPTTTAGFITPPDGGGGTKDCDQRFEDCPEGQKCVPYSADGDAAWESTKCFDIVPAPAGLGEPCESFDIALGGDTCDFHMMCWNVDPDTGLGTCIAKCIGDPETPDCANPLEYCVVAADAVLILCLPMCHPLAEDCDRGQPCVPYPIDGTTWWCEWTIDAPLFAPCDYPAACASGLHCGDPTHAVECPPNADGCCLPLCDTTQPNTCPGQGQECLPWYPEGDALPGYESVGACRLPMP